MEHFLAMAKKTLTGLELEPETSGLTVNCLLTKVAQIQKIKIEGAWRFDSSRTFPHGSFLGSDSPARIEMSGPLNVKSSRNRVVCHNVLCGRSALVCCRQHTRACRHLWYIAMGTLLSAVWYATVPLCLRCCCVGNLNFHSPHWMSAGLGSDPHSKFAVRPIYQFAIFWFIILWWCLRGVSFSVSF